MWVKIEEEEKKMRMRYLWEVERRSVRMKIKNIVNRQS
jgi:hypothetical protein